LFVDWLVGHSVNQPVHYFIFIRLNQGDCDFAQTVTLARAMELKHNPSLISALANETYKLFSDAAKTLDSLADVASQWIKYLHLKAAVYQAYVCFNHFSNDK
jgi:hypothetical protein